jgi:hypothetical protein
MERVQKVWIVAAVTGALYVTACYRAPGLIDWEPMQHVYLSVGVLLPISFALSLLARRGPFLVGLFLLAGICMGTIVDAFLDVISRNLFPFEIAWWLVLFSPSIILGAVGAWLVQRARHNQSPELDAH